MAWHNLNKYQKTVCILEFNGHCMFPLNKNSTPKLSYFINNIPYRQEVYFIKELFK